MISHRVLRAKIVRYRGICQELICRSWVGEKFDSPFLIVSRKLVST